MKTKFACIGMLSLAFIACDNKEEVTRTDKTEATKKKAFGAEQRPIRLKPVAPAPATSGGSGIAQVPSDEGGVARVAGEENADGATPPAAPTAFVPADPETARLQAERKARMAAAREERTGRVTEQITNRIKQQDANGDGLLAKDELDGRMQGRFDAADTNGDGFLDATEQAAMVQGASRRMAEGGGQRQRGQRGQGGENGGQGGRRNRNP